MSRRSPAVPGDGDVLTQISDGIVALLKEYSGKGPAHTRTYLQDDLVVCIMRGGTTPVEQTLLDAGRINAVRLQRIEFHDVMRDRFTAVVENATGRQVIGFMSGSQHLPDMLSELFVLSAAAAPDAGELPPTVG